ncbi:MGH1-like glycoside hydrolase domain-containing protein [Paenibacillus sp. PAMC21692]|uniref:MGH1-like glycoside hydrolase domain-containing protein n=1 Tax=Paenibacillus sp. PAMC21692 TaxID=2762320 RepID=UPI00164E2EEE|nr:trehalase family glycosidase [Paenibacillus sp. PAMC21692]QNK57002.1 hypothetical protein H7F31_31660 [Paenibacillus sp. PAMC21692]
MEHLKGSHDLSLSDWGPYSKKYIGISHVADRQKGVRFDLSVIPGFYRRKVDVPNVMWESGYHPWEASPDLSYISHRHELQWKDEVYCDISFSKLTDKSRLIRCEAVNSTERTQNLVLHLISSIHFPQVLSHGETLNEYTREGTDRAVWVDALDYEDLLYSRTRPTDNLVYDGWFRGEARGHGFVCGSGLAKGFGADRGDRVSYRIPGENVPNDAWLVFRYRVAPGKTAQFKLKGSMQSELEFTGGSGFELLKLQVLGYSSGDLVVELVSNGEIELELDGIALVPADQLNELEFVPVTWNPTPEIMEGPCKQSIVLKYSNSSNYYGLKWLSADFQVRQFITAELDRFMRHTVHHHAQTVLKGEGAGHFTDIYIRPITIQAHSTAVLYGMVCEGSSYEEAAKHLADFNHPEFLLDRLYEAAHSRKADLLSNSAGSQYVFSQERMAATLLMNVVYPVYVKRSYIKHSTPGRWWDSLYTWDSGFIGLGYAELDLERAIESLNAYVTEPGDPHAAFIHHGSPVPVQMYLYQELWNRTQSRELLRFFYPRLRQYYLFMIGRLGSSTIGRLSSGLLNTWDYFYNSGGWDDYPPQQYIHDKGICRKTAPTVTTSHCIRAAKILRMAALELGRLEDDLDGYDQDIASMTSAIQAYTWDEESGYFGYLLHDEQGNPLDILRHESGANFNMGIDGIAPLVAGICSEHQTSRIMSHMFDEQRLWTPIGISSVDQTAPYFKGDGYWNGAVWMPHQWFLWKTMLDLGEAGKARKIADTALALWKRETEDTYHCFEHFIVQSGKGAGWHQFGGLSSPVLNWFSAYYRPGRLTVGFNTWVSFCSFEDDNRTCRALLRNNSSKGFNVIATMNPGSRYRAICNGQAVDVKRVTAGTLELTLHSIAEEEWYELMIESMDLP